MKTRKQVQRLRDSPAAYTKFQHYEPHDLLNGSHIFRYYLDQKLLSSSVAAHSPLFSLFLGDSVLNQIWQAFVLMSPEIRPNIDWRFGGVHINDIHSARGWTGNSGSRGQGPATLMKWFVNMSLERYSNLTDFAISTGSEDPLFRAIGREPTHVVMSAGLWDAQSRPLSEFNKFLPILVRALKTLFPGTHIVWVTSPPIYAAKMKGRHYRTNEYLSTVARTAKSVLAGVDGLTVVDGFGILSVARHTSIDGRHYPVSSCLDVANILWNVILSTQAAHPVT
jgi:hypothetical protein